MYAELLQSKYRAYNGRLEPLTDLDEMNVDWPEENSSHTVPSHLLISSIYLLEEMTIAGHVRDVDFADADVDLASIDAKFKQPPLQDYWLWHSLGRIT
jgi:hypothetical protein